MTELEITRRAKTYLDALAQGVDPLSGRPIPPGDTLSQDRLRRCFRYVSGVLEKVIAEQSGFTVSAPPESVAAPPPPPKRDHAAAPPPPPKRDYAAAIRAVLQGTDVVSAAPYSQEPVTLASFWIEVCREILMPLGFRNVMTTRLFPWMEAKGFFSGPVDGEETVVTEKGRALGLSLQIEENEGKKRHQCYAGEPAQRMIMENLEELMVWDQEQWDAYMAWAGRPEAFQYSAQPLKILELTRRINALAAGGACAVKVSYGMILQWLIRQGYMQEADRLPGDHTPARIPTPQGNMLGITLRSGERSSSVLYDENAQRFIMESLPEIVDGIRVLPVL